MDVALVMVEATSIIHTLDTTMFAHRAMARAAATTVEERASRQHTNQRKKVEM